MEIHRHPLSHHKAHQVKCGNGHTCRREGVFVMGNTIIRAFQLWILKGYKFEHSLDINIFNIHV